MYADDAKALLGLLEPERCLTSAYPIVEGFSEQGKLGDLYAFAQQLESLIAQTLPRLFTPHFDVDSTNRSRILLVRGAALLSNLTGVDMTGFEPFSIPSELVNNARVTCQNLFAALALSAMQSYALVVYSAVVAAHIEKLDILDEQSKPLQALWESSEAMIYAVTSSMTYYMTHSSSVCGNLHA